MFSIEEIFIFIQEITVDKVVVEWSQTINYSLCF